MNTAQPASLTKEQISDRMTEINLRIQAIDSENGKLHQQFYDRQLELVNEKKSLIIEAAGYLK